MWHSCIFHHLAWKHSGSLVRRTIGWHPSPPQPGAPEDAILPHLVMALSCHHTDTASVISRLSGEKRQRPIFGMTDTTPSTLLSRPSDPCSSRARVDKVSSHMRQALWRFLCTRAHTRIPPPLVSLDIVIGSNFDKGVKWRSHLRPSVHPSLDSGSRARGAQLAARWAGEERIKMTPRRGWRSCECFQVGEQVSGLRLRNLSGFQCQQGSSKRQQHKVRKTWKRKFHWSNCASKHTYIWSNLSTSEYRSEDVFNVLVKCLSMSKQCTKMFPNIITSHIKS